MAATTADTGADKLELGEKYKVRLELPTSANIRSQYGSQRRVVFEVTPDLIENRNVNYKSYDPVHLPGAIYVYATTASRIFNVSGVRFVSRTPDEAFTNYQNLLTLKSWTMPVFGTPFGSGGGANERTDVAGPNQGGTQDSASLDRFRAANPVNDRQRDKRRQEQQRNNFINNYDYTEGLLGQPPPVLWFSAYHGGTEAASTQWGGGHIGRVPVVIQQLTVPYPSDVDYIPTSINQVPMPTILTLDITLLETHSPKEYSRFSLEQYKNGLLEHF